MNGMDEHEENSVALLSFDLLPPELQTLIFLELDLPTLAAATRVSTTWHAMIEEPVMWKLKCQREFPFYLEGAPLPEDECIVPDEKNYKLTLEELEDAAGQGNEQVLLRLITLIQQFTQAHAQSGETAGEVEATTDDLGFPPLLSWAQPPAPSGSASPPGGSHRVDEGVDHQPVAMPSAPTSEANPPGSTKELRPAGIDDWKAFYKQCHNSIDINGRWIGHYGSHGKELIQIAHRGFRVLATKITGDVNVPAGKPTFRMALTAKGDRGKGQMHLADTGYVRARWGRAYLEVQDKDNLVVKWFYGIHPSQHFDTTYERVKGDITLPLLQDDEEEEEEELSDLSSDSGDDDYAPEFEEDGGNNDNIIHNFLQGGEEHRGDDDVEELEEDMQLEEEEEGQM